LTDYISFGGAVETTETTSYIGHESATKTTQKSIPLFANINWSFNFPFAYFGFEINYDRPEKKRSWDEVMKSLNIIKEEDKLYYQQAPENNK